MIRLGRCRELMDKCSRMSIDQCTLCQLAVQAISGAARPSRLRELRAKGEGKPERRTVFHHVRWQQCRYALPPYS